MKDLTNSPVTNNPKFSPEIFKDFVVYLNTDTREKTDQKLHELICEKEVQPSWLFLQIVRPALEAFYGASPHVIDSIVELDSLIFEPGGHYLRPKNKICVHKTKKTELSNNNTRKKE